MDDITESLRIIDNTIYNINGIDTFHSSSFVYKMSNEDVNLYRNYLKKSKRILSVISSGDQIIESITNEKKIIDCFDISKYPKYYLMLKLAAIKGLKKEDYIKLFIDSPSTYLDEYYDDLYYDNIRKNLFGIYKKYWDELFNHTDWYEIYSSRLFQSDGISNDFIYNSLSYLEDKNYYKLKENIDNVKLNFYEGNILNIIEFLNGKYDLVYLSNIIDYIDKNIYKSLLSKFNLTNDGVVLSYIFSNIDKYKDIFEFCERKKESETSKGILVYKN